MTIGSDPTLQEGLLVRKKKRDFYNLADTSMTTEVDQQQKLAASVSGDNSPQSSPLDRSPPASMANTANSRSSGFMITDILSNANRGQAAAAAAVAAAAAAAALQNRLQGSGMALHPSLTEFHLQQQLQQFQAHHQQQLHHHHEASSDDGEPMSDDETTSSKDAYDQGKAKKPSYSD